jgi:hypothetical protein
MHLDFSQCTYPKDSKHFQSWLEFVTYCQQHRRRFPSDNPDDGCLAKRPMSITKEPEKEWDDNLGLDGALELAQTGWHKGMLQADKISAPLVEKIVGQMERPEIFYDVEGDNLDVARFVENDPECFMRLDSEIIECPSANPRLIRLLHYASESGAVDARDIMRKGAHTMALIQALEFAGHRVELTVMVYSTASIHGRNTKPAAACAVTVKPFDEPINPGLAIFALAHPALLRRLGFVFAENMSKDAQENVGSAYGVPCNLKTNADIEINSRIGVIDMNWIQEQLKKQGITLR